VRDDRVEWRGCIARVNFLSGPTVYNRGSPALFLKYPEATSLCLKD
jgi:hypothetical protein